MNLNAMSLKSEINEEKKKILRWIIQWIKYPKNILNDNNTDASEIASLLQCLGFSLNAFEKCEEETSPDIIDNTIKIEITCLKSNMRVTMSKPLSNCSCPSSEDAKNAELWNVSGCEPNADKILKSNSSLLPPVSPSKNNVIGGLLQKILEIINETENPTHDLLPEEIIPKQIAIELIPEPEAAGIPGLVAAAATRNWELEPLASPPKSTSSPLPSPLLAMSHMSGSSDKENRLADLLKGIVKFGEEAYTLATVKNFTYTKSKRLSNIKVSPLVDNTTPIVGAFIDMNQTRNKEFALVKKTPKNATPKKLPTTAEKKKNLLQPQQSKMGYNRKKPTTPSTPTTTRNLTPRTETPRPNLMYKEGQKPKTFITPVSVDNVPARVSKIKPFASRIATAIPKGK